MRSRWLPLILLSIGVFALGGAIVSISVGEYEESEFEITGAGEVQQLVAGIEQEGDRLGPPEAELTIDVFTDLQSPDGADYQRQVVDPLIAGHVRTGEAAIVLRHFPLGVRPLTLAGVAAEAAGLQDRQWQYAELFVRNLAEIPEGGVTEEFLGEVASMVPELEVTQWEQDLAGSEATELARADERLAAELTLPADPAVIVTGPGGSEELIEAPSLEEVEAAIERLG